MVAVLLLVGEELVDVDLAHILVGELVEVALDVAGREARRAAGEERVDGVPCQTGTVVAAGHRRLVLVLGEHGRHAGDEPRGGRQHVDGVLGVLEVVQVGGIVLYAMALTGNEVGKLARERDARRLCAMQQRQAVEQVGEPLRLFVPVDVDAPQGVVQGLIAHDHLGSERLLGEVLEGSAQLQVLREVVFPVDAHHGLALLGIVGVALERGTDGCVGIEDALVENGHLAGRVVHGVVAALGELHATGGDHHRALRNVARPE